MILNTLKPSVEQINPRVVECGLRVLELKRGYVKCLLPEDRQPAGGFSKAILRELMEAPATALFHGSFNTVRFEAEPLEIDLKLGQPPECDVTVELTMKEAIISRLTAEAEIRGRTEMVLEAVLRDEDARTVARYRGVFEMRQAGERVSAA